MSVTETGVCRRNVELRIAESKLQFGAKKPGPGLSRLCITRCNDLAGFWLVVRLEVLDENFQLLLFLLVATGLS